MGLLDVVDEKDNITGKEHFSIVHEKGLRHRSVNIFVFEDSRLARVLLSERSKSQAVSTGKIHVSAGGHVNQGQSYLDAAEMELREELFYGRDSLPAGVLLTEIARYSNNSRPTNKENTCLYSAVYAGPFFPDPSEIRRVFWGNMESLTEDIFSGSLNRNYTNTLKEAVKFFRKFKGIL